MFHTTRLLALASSALVIVGLTACAPMAPANQASTFPSTSNPSNSTQGAYVEFGRITNVEVVRLQQPSTTPGLGAVLGGVAGAVVGSQIGTGGGRTGATIIGAVGGAVAGNARKELEIKTGQKVVTTQNYLTEQDKKKNNQIAFQSAKKKNK